MPHPWKMPPEWEPQDATWVAWPHNLETWPTNLADARAEFVEFVRAIADHQPVMVLAGSVMDSAAKMLEPIDNVQLIDIPTNDAWIRDYGPTFVVNEDLTRLAAVDWQYNAWGGKYPPFDCDAAVAQKIARLLNVERIESGLFCEGGAIEVNGEGCLLSSRSCVLNPNRNPHVGQRMVEFEWQSTLGVQKTIWIPGDSQEFGLTIEGDDTDGHIDQCLRFVGPSKVVMAWPDDDDPRQRALEHNRSQLMEALIEAKLNFWTATLPLPKPIQHCERTLPASYCNFLITNEKVIVPKFNDPKDAVAIDILSDFFADRSVVGLPSINLAVGLGSFHCLSQQQPRLNDSAKD